MFSTPGVLAFFRQLGGRACLCGTLVALLWGVSAGVSAQDRESPWRESRGEDLSIQLVTFGPGDDVYNYFGHNALVVHDRATGMARLYNYGMFHFGPDMLPNYMKGRLTFWVGESPVRETFARYIEMNRSVRVQELNLSPERRKTVAAALAHNVLPENRTYLYHHYYDNCSTRLRDILDQATGGQFRAALAVPARMSYREHTRRYAQHDPVVDFALLFWMNDQMEQAIEQWHELFLPEELERQVSRMRYVDESGTQVPLVAATHVVYEAKRAPTPAEPPVSWPRNLLAGAGFGLLACLVAWATRKRHAGLGKRLFGVQHALMGVAFGVPGLLGFLMWTLTEHTVTYRNENQLLANPITFALLPLGLAMLFGSKRAVRLARYGCYALAAGSLALVVFKALPAFDQDTTLPMALLLPVNLGFALAHFLFARAEAARA